MNRPLKIALTGNPNSGKTSLFNALTGAHQHVGNWAGVTVEVKEGECRHGDRTVTVVDLPGTYSLSAFSMEERVARDFIVNEKVDVVIDVIDATNLERNLYLAIQIIELGVRPVLAFNMWDEVAEKKVRVDVRRLEQLLDVSIVPTVGKTGEGVETLIDTALQCHEAGRTRSPRPLVAFPPPVEAGITALAREPAVTDLAIYPPRWTALKLLERDRQICDKVAAGPSGTSLHDILRLTNDRIYHEAGDSADNVIAESRYGFIAGAVRETVRKSMGSRIELTDKIDRAMTHPLLAYPIFLAFMWVLFQATFTLGEYPMRLIELLFSGAGSLVSAHVPPSLLRGLIADGIIAGVGGVLVFLPNILILFMGIAVMEDTGYMARAAFIMDKIMHSIGLHGKSFIPILIGMGCNVPAIMAARTLESERDRIKTILLTPLISCSARLPVYVLFAGSLFPRHAGTVVFLFHFGFSLAAFFGMGFIFKKTLFKEGDYPFVMELPPYRLPTARSVLIHMWQRTRHYLKKMGGVVLVCSVVLWALGTFPLQRATRQALDETARQIRDDGALSDSEKTAALQAHDRAAHARIMSGTYIGRTGRLLEPLVRPLGFDWRGAVALLSGFFAKEIVVSSMSVLYAADGEDGEAAPQLRSAVRRHFSPLAGLAFMTFVLLYTPCVVALVTVVKELKNWKWSAFSVVYQIVFAWVTAFIIYQGGRLVGLR